MPTNTVPLLKSDPCPLPSALNSFAAGHEWRILRPAQFRLKYYFQLDTSELSDRGISTLWVLLNSPTTPADVYKLNLAKGLLWVPSEWVLGEVSYA